MHSSNPHTLRLHCISTSVSGNLLLHYVLSCINCMFQAKAQYGSDAGWSGTSPSGYGENERPRGSRKRTILCRAHHLQDRGCNVSAHIIADICMWIYLSFFIYCLCVWRSVVTHTTDHYHLHTPFLIYIYIYEALYIQGSILGIYIYIYETLTQDVPQGSILGPLLFNIYLLPHGHIFCCQSQLPLLCWWPTTNLLILPQLFLFILYIYKVT